MLFILNNEKDIIFVEKLYAEYSKFMYKVAFSILKDSYYSEDAVSRAFVRIIENIDKITGLEKKRLRNYIGVICRNEAFDLYNKSAKDMKYIFASENTYENNDVSLIVVSKDSIKRLEEFILGMDIKYQEVIFLKSMNCFSLKQIAEVLDIKSETVRKRLERCRAKIKEFLRQEEEIK